ncbi:hypothetical protein [Roseateles amylovorans]|uniref:Uncharacterized protein n=1 Tax=Roseateles amylovorans TaxID=2978473 RepID=A0ABY6AWI5_9BURK|nr:hypothetical protein [Roseateles amylovorans]UXH76129.1 hypothetical protein N4261_13710 [Roseateles amylovorans]
MPVSVAGRPIQQPGALSELGRLSLAFVDGGPEWLQWAAATPSVRYDFPDESTLLAQVQLGLHGSPLALLPNLALMVSPIKLMSLGHTDLLVLAKAEGGNDSPLLSTQVTRILDDQQLLTQVDLMAPQTWLKDLGVDGAPVLQANDLGDRIALVRLMRDPLLAASVGSEAGDLTQEAATFAVQQARTPQEFADYLRFYLALVTKAGAPSQGPSQRLDRVTQAMRTLLPLFFGALDCPQVSGLPSPEEVGRAVAAWLSSGKQVGFSRLSEAVLQVALNTRFLNETGTDARQLVEVYLNAAQGLLGAVKIRNGLLGQDGSTCVFDVQSSDQQAELQLSANGIISLREFGLLNAAKPAPVSDPSTTESTS